MKRCPLVKICDVCDIAPKRKKTGRHGDHDANINYRTSVSNLCNVVTNNENISSPKSLLSNPKPIDIFALNDYCMRDIYKYCSIADLFNMCIASDELKTSILDNSDVRERMIDFSELADCCNILDIFKIFGQHMTKIIIGEKDIQYKARKFSKFDEILRLISTYCAIDTLKYLNVQYYYGTIISKNVLRESLPFFRCIESFVIKETDHDGTEVFGNYLDVRPKYNSSINSFVEQTVGNAVNMTSLEIHNLKITGQFFHRHHVRNLETLSLRGCNVRVPVDFISYLQDNRKLKSFSWDNSSLRGMDTSTSHSSNEVFKLATNNMPDLEAFYYDPNEGFINDQNQYDYDFDFVHPDEQLLLNFIKLKIFSIHGLTVECLKVLTRRNTVEQLITGYSQISTNSVDLNFLQNFGSLKCIHLTVSAVFEVKMFNIILLEQLPQLTECHLGMIDNDDIFIATAVESAKGLSILSIKWRRGELTSSLYSRLLQIRLKYVSPLIIKIEGKSLKNCLKSLGNCYRGDVIKISAM